MNIYQTRFLLKIHHQPSCSECTSFSLEPYSNRQNIYIDAIGGATAHTYDTMVMAPFLQEWYTSVARWH